MPGLLWPRRILEIDPPGNENPCLQSSLDKLLQAPPARSPLTPTKHKACRPSLSPASWMINSKAAEELNRSSAALTQSNNDQGSGSESEHDLAAMVHEFIENGSDHQCDSDGDGASSKPSKLCDKLKVLGSSKSFLEAELLANVSALLLSLGEESISCSSSDDCKGACVRQLVVKHLKSLGYDAAVCKLKWQISGNVPGGDYEYVDVVFDKKDGEDHRLILDLDFQSQFEIARPTQSYKAALKLLPAVYVGTVKRLHNILEIMSEAAEVSLTQNSMHLPPWRTIEYMFAKWLSSPHERSSSKVVPVSSNPSQTRQFGTDRNRKPCWEQIRRIKEALRASEESSSSAPSVRRTRGNCLPRRRTNKW